MSLASEEKTQTQMENAILDMIASGMAEPRMAIIGCGGAGVNIIGRMGGHFRGVPRIAINTDMNGLMLSEADRKICIGKSITFNGDSGGYPEVAMKCAELAEEDIRSCLLSKDVVFIIAAFGGGTGTGVAKMVADTAKGLGMVAFGICILPFSAESSRRERAEAQAEEFRKLTDNCVILDNDALLKFDGIKLDEAFRVMDRMVVRMIKDITDSMGRSYLATLANEIIAYQNEMGSGALEQVGMGVGQETGAFADGPITPLAFPQVADENLVDSGGVFQRF